MTATGPPRVDTPRAAYRVLEWRATVLTVGLLVGLAALAWWSTIDRAHDMSGMVDGLSSTGMTMMPFDLSVSVFLAMWLTMMVAMMFPTVAPIVLLHRMVMRRAGRGPWLTVAFVGGYLLAWTLAGVVPLAALVAFRSAAPGATWIGGAAGAALIVAGLYQFTAWKAACQRACRSPLTFLSTHDFGTGWGGAVRVGAVHGFYCLGCCWALMAVLVVVGLMNLVWMAAIAVVFLVEKHWRHGLALARVAGVAIALLGVAVLVSPAVLDSLSQM